MNFVLIILLHYVTIFFDSTVRLYTMNMHNLQTYMKQPIQVGFFLHLLQLSFLCAVLSKIYFVDYNV